MRPPDLPGGNSRGGFARGARFGASMRPPDLPGGNEVSLHADVLRRVLRFNEAAGFTRRKHPLARRFKASGGWLQ